MGDNLQRVKSQAHLMVGPHRQMGMDRSLGLALEAPPDDIIAGQPREVHAAGVAQRRASQMRLAHLKSFILFFNFCNSDGSISSLVLQKWLFSNHFYCFNLNNSSVWMMLILPMYSLYKVSNETHLCVLKKQSRFLIQPVYPNRLP